MKYLFITFFICSLISCHQSKIQNWYSFELVDSDNLKLGKVTCNLPLEIDTFYKWINISDSGCGVNMYRANSKKYKIVEETGFFHEELDSGFYFTITHYRHISCDTQSLPWNITQTKEQIRKMNIEYFIKDQKEKTQKGAPEAIVDTSRMINNNIYDVFYEQDEYGKNPFNILTASTKFNSRFIGFTIQSNVHPRDSFYDIAMDILKSIRIE
jgi:hypothetical protein